MHGREEVREGAVAEREREVGGKDSINGQRRQGQQPSHEPVERNNEGVCELRGDRPAGVVVGGVVRQVRQERRAGVGAGSEVREALEERQEGGGGGVELVRCRGGGGGGGGGRGWTRLDEAGEGQMDAPEVPLEGCGGRRLT